MGAGPRAASAVVLAVLLGLTACTAGSGGATDTPPETTDRVCDSDGCVSLRTFIANVEAAVRDKVVGYLVLAGRVPAVLAGGQARTAADPPQQAMSDSVMVNSASVGSWW